MKNVIKVTWILMLFTYEGIAQKNVVFEVIDKIKFENINKELKDSILSKGKFYPSTNEPDYIEYYSLQVDTIKQQARIEFGYESGQRAYAVDEIKLFKKSDGNYKVIYSNCTGANAMINQSNLIFYDFNVKTTNLKPDTLTHAIFDYKPKDFYKPKTKSSIIKNNKTPLDFTYDLYYAEKFDVELRLVCFLLSVDLTENKYLLGDKIGFSWRNDRFEKSVAYFDK